MVSKSIWKEDPRKGLRTDFLERLEKIGHIFTYTPIFSTYLQFDKNNKFKDFDKKYTFNLEDILFENYCKFIYDQIKHIKKNFISLEEGCHYANYFANKYHNKCIGLFLIGNRRFNKENYLKSIERGERMIKLEYGEGYENLIGNNLTNDNLHWLLSKLDQDQNEKYIVMIGYYIGLILRGQYDNIPKKMLVPTFIYNRITLSRDIILQHNLKDVKTQYIKDIQSENQAIMTHCTTNMDKYDADQELIKNSDQGLVKSYYIANENFNLFMMTSKMI